MRNAVNQPLGDACRLAGQFGQSELLLWSYWQRIAPHIESLAGKTVLDVGCGSGYHCWRMLGAGADLVIGIDPTPLFAA